ncbi:MAG TPA: hypothetical protein DIT25_02085 [Candidatus Moranbacteria bacterium]|nr:hypothetical protein [Candidatus Moranbacteria bacterium]
MKRFWKFVYIFWPSVLRAYETFFHHHRQDFLIGHLAAQKITEDLERHLAMNGFERAIIALKDPGEILDMRKREGEEFQYHIRLFNDREIRTHYEYAPEAHLVTHCFNVCQEKKETYFKELLNEYLA